ncbi:MAG TPA: hypothetical protein VJN44_08030 [Roseateles sp.]|nr:hypothetical protein [Roseateles sp.]
MRESKTSDAQREHILAQLQRVNGELAARAAQPGLEERVGALKRYQQQRFRRSYADLLASPRYAAAARFFLDELYGPGDFSRRDAQFARVVPSLIRLFPAEVVETVAQLAELHALSEQLDTEMGRQLGAPQIAAADYARAWQAAATPAQRERQIELLLAVGRALDGLTRKPLLRQALRMMRKPAAAAGLAELQRFLETGFDTFKAMAGAEAFLQTVTRRERALADALFAPLAPAQLAACPAGDSVLGQLP